MLVLRCRARNREEAEHEGSSSGEDSDIFANRPTLGEQTEMTTPAFDAIAQTSKSQELVEEDTGLGLIGIFDGANDIPSHDGGYDNASGRWIWHQSRPPFAGFTDTPEYFQPEGYPFRSQSYARPPGRYAAEEHQDRRTFSGPTEKRVHFDDGHTRRSPILRQYGRATGFRHPQPQRPLSRTRERLPSDSSQDRSTSVYGPQRISDSPNGLGRFDSQNGPIRRQKRNSPYQDDPKSATGYGSGSGNNDRENHQSTPPQTGQVGSTGQGTRNGSPFGAQQENGNPNYASNSTGRPDEAAAQNVPRQNSFHNSQHVPVGSFAQEGNGRCPRGPTAPNATQSRYTQYPSFNHELQDHGLPAPYPYIPAHTYGYPPQVPHGYYYPQNQYMGYGPFTQQYPHFYSETFAQPGTIPAYSMHPPHIVHPHLEEQVSPLNVQGNLGNHKGSNGGDHAAVSQEGNNESQAWATNGNDTSGGQQNNGNGYNWNQNNGMDNLNNANNQEAGD